jgi:hypothetical protein
LKQPEAGPKAYRIDIVFMVQVRMVDGFVVAGLPKANKFVLVRA